MTPVIRIDDEVMGALKKRAIDFNLVFEPPNATLRRVLGLDSNILAGKVTRSAIPTLQSPSAAPMTPSSKRQRFGRIHTAMSVKDTVTDRAYPSKYRAGLAFAHEFPKMGRRYLWYALIRKYPGRFVEITTGNVR